MAMRSMRSSFASDEYSGMSTEQKHVCAWGSVASAPRLEALMCVILCLLVHAPSAGMRDRPHTNLQ